MRRWAIARPPPWPAAPGKLFPARLHLGRQASLRHALASAPDGVEGMVSATVSCAPSPIEPTRRQSVSPRQPLSGEVGLRPAATNSRQRSSTGSYPRALIPSAEQPISVARIGACRSCSWRLVCETTCRPRPSISEAPCADRAPGLFIVLMAYFLVLELRAPAAPCSHTIREAPSFVCCSLCNRLPARPWRSAIARPTRANRSPESTCGGRA